MEKNNDDEHANKDATVDTNISDFKKKINLEEKKYEVSKDKDKVSSLKFWWFLTAKRAKTTKICD